MIEVITFDLDDTLWDVRPALIKAEAAQNFWLDTHYPNTNMFILNMFADLHMVGL